MCANRIYVVLPQKDMENNFANFSCGSGAREMSEEPIIAFSPGNTPLRKSCEIFQIDNERQLLYQSRSSDTEDVQRQRVRR